MALPFLNGKPKRVDHVIAVDLGGRTTKAVEIQRKGGGYVLNRFALLDAPIYEKEKGPTAELLGEHLKTVCRSLGARTRHVTVALDTSESLVRQAELPMLPFGDLRQMLKTSHKNFLQQELPNHTFDCTLLIPRDPAKAQEVARAASGGKQRFLVAAAQSQLVEDVQAAIKSSGFQAENVVPGLVGPINAFEQAMPEIFAKEAVALVDIGFRSTSICLLLEGELMLSRVVPIGGDRLTTALAEVMGISYGEAESIKLGLPTEVQPQLEAILSPLGRELRASMDHFEHQHDRPIAHVFISGGSSKSQLIVQMLQTELLVECKAWNPIGFLELALPADQAGEIDQAGSQLTVAVGSALATL